MYLPPLSLNEPALTAFESVQGALDLGLQLQAAGKPRLCSTRRVIYFINLLMEKRMCAGGAGGDGNIQTAVWQIMLDFFQVAGIASEGITPATPFMDAGLDSLDMLKLARWELALFLLN